LTSNLKARASWSTSYGRAPLASLVSAATANDTVRTLTIGNPALRPQLGKNLDLKLEYYFKTGMVTVRGYQKNITDYIGSAGRSGQIVGTGNDNGFEGLYEGYEIVQPLNLGAATYKGLEFDYRQRLTFLPGLLKGLTARANYTYLQAKGKFAGTIGFNPGQVAGFIPRAYNVGLLYNYRKFGASFDVNYTGKYPVTYSLTAPGNGNRYRKDWTVMNVGLTYEIFRDTKAFISLNNIAQQGPEEYMFEQTRTRSIWVVPRTLKFGITGQF